ncbi:MAG: UvrD-helicase domain-containing protein [Spirochaetales bacterium]|nr:UvrD-helicase domain-containing protein [Spirochaetales bacterium]
MSEAPWLSGLNEKQKEAVIHGADPLLILAGAGSGKTRVVTSRIAWMVAEKGFDAPSILAVTFTNRAAAEMRERVTALHPRAEGAMIRTFHSFGAWLLRRNASAIGLSPNFSIYDDDDQVSLLAQVLEGVPRKELRLWAHRISRAKDEGLGPEDDLSSFSHDPSFPEVYQAYEKRLRDIGNADFGDLIRLPLLLLRQRPEIKKRIQQRFKAVLVDEYQDTNVAQYLLLKELVGPETWVGVVGDDDQSIYRFRGAEVENILTFPDSFKGTQVVKLEQNYRSTGCILDIASAVVSHNTGRLGKTLWTDGAAGEKAVVAYLDNHDDEAQWCANLVDADGDFGNTAILYRTNAQSRAFETHFRKRDIPYRIVGTVSFYQREEVKDVLAYLCFLSNPKDEIAFRRIANKPARGLGKTSLERLSVFALRDFQGDFLASCRENLLKGRAAKATTFLAELSDRYQNAEFEHLGFLVQDLVEESGLLSHYREVDRVENTKRTENLEELVTAASEYPSSPQGLAAFLELVELDQAVLEEEEEDENRVTLITMHNTKGLEFDRVIITGLEDGLFPRGEDASDEEELEEERRLFYVAITRARKTLAFTSCRRRMIWGRYRDSLPSLFLKELPEDSVRVEGAPTSRFSSNDPWRPGVRLYHEEYGVGVVQKRLSNGGSHPAILVQFESGRSATLLPEFSSHQMEMLGSVENDWS